MVHGCAIALAKLVEAGEGHIHVACAKCGRGGRYNIECLLRAYVELSPMSFLESVTLGCERRIAKNSGDPCAAIYAELESLPPSGA